MLLQQTKKPIPAKKHQLPSPHPPEFLNLHLHFTPKTPRRGEKSGEVFCFLYSVF